MENEDNPQSNYDYYDQYCNFDQIPKLLKRFSFSEKIRICNKYSRIFMQHEISNEVNKLIKLPLPWYIETFLLLSVEAQEYTSGDFTKKNENKFIKMINAIGNYIPKAMQIKNDTFNSKNYSFADTILPVIALTQFHIHEFEWFKYYRYYWLFTFQNESLNLKDIFQQKFNTDYIDFLDLGIYLKIIFLNESTSPAEKEIVEYLINTRFPKAAQHLIISREDYIFLSHKLVSNPDDKSEYIFSVRPSYQFAFIVFDNNLFFPLPHLITQNITSALLYRLTDPQQNKDGNALRDKIGKNVLEPYLFEILFESKIYDEIYPECNYKAKRKNNSLSPDVMVRQKNDYLFLDSKLTVPGIGIRFFDINAYEKNIEITAQNIIKLYNQIKSFPLRYNPFKVFSKDDDDFYWGTVVVFEDSYVLRNKVYHKVFEELSILDNSKTAIWLKEHIKVVSLYEVERLSFCSKSIIDAIKEQNTMGDPEDFPFPQTNNGDITNLKLQNFKEIMLNRWDNITKELISEGLIKQ